MNLQELIDNLPLELVYKIMSYILKPQPKILLNDIKNYYLTKNLGMKLYSKKYENEPMEIKNWFANDLNAYMNDNLPLMYGYIEKYYDIYFRLKCVIDKEQILNFVLKINKKPAIKEINTIWGLLIAKERIDMISDNFSAEEIKEVT
jgi:hypothetical protein|uniref:Uncharacterized protein n=1 Tax=Mimiviridae sp. ChoanoV1 TaxID=2596887 RepID=A0A5B8IFV4_9VIRU|nr:hypothetical protein 6_40 [Mimiviridae sp. ChoanoV1]